jgi:hypothetical protein
MNLLYLNNEQPPAKQLVVAHPPMPTQTRVITNHHIHINASQEKQSFNHKLYKVRQSIREIKQEEKAFWTSQISSTQLNDYKKRFQNIQNQIRALHKECSEHLGCCTSIDHNVPNDQIIHIKLIIKVLEKLKHDLEFFEAQFDKKYGEWSKKGKQKIVNEIQSPSYNDQVLPNLQKQKDFDNRLQHIKQYIKEIKQEEKTVWASKSLSNKLNNYKDTLQDTQNKLIDFYADCNTHFNLLLALPYAKTGTQVTHIKSIIKLLIKIEADFELFQVRFDKKHNEWLKQEYKAKLELINNTKKQANELQQQYTIAQQELDYKITELWSKYQQKYPDATTQQLVNYVRAQEPTTLFKVTEDQNKIDYLKMEHRYTIKTIDRLGEELNDIKVKFNLLTINEEDIQQLWKNYEHSGDSEEFWQTYQHKLEELNEWRQIAYSFKN